MSNVEPNRRSLPLSRSDASEQAHITHNQAPINVEPKLGMLTGIPSCSETQGSVGTPKTDSTGTKRGLRSAAIEVLRYSQMQVNELIS